MIQSVKRIKPTHPESSFLLVLQTSRIQGKGRDSAPPVVAGEGREGETEEEKEGEENKFWEPGLLLGHIPGITNSTRSQIQRFVSREVKKGQPRRWEPRSLNTGALSFPGHCFLLKSHLVR